MLKLAHWMLIATLSNQAPADVPPICEEMSKPACAPGHYQDGTGEVRSEESTRKALDAIAERARDDIRKSVDALLDDPKRAHTRDLAMVGLGLKSTPDCEGESAAEKAACRKNLAEGLTAVVHKVVFNGVREESQMLQRGNLAGLQHLMLDHHFERLVGEHTETIRKEIARPEVMKKIEEKIFPGVQRAIAERIKTMPISDAHKKFMTDKINSIAFNPDTVCDLGPTDGQASVLSMSLTSNAFYSPSRNSFQICGGFTFQADSEFLLAYTIGHELSHAIDPCNIANGPKGMAFQYSDRSDIAKLEKEYPASNVIRCLRDRRSVAAQKAPPQGDSPAQMLQMLGVAVKGRNEFCNKDPIIEAFCDWMGAEVLPAYMAQNHKLTQSQYRNGYANSWRLGCTTEEQENHARARNPNFPETHPRTSRRINSILLVNPKVRADMGCPPKHSEYMYCDADKTHGEILLPEDPRKRGRRGMPLPPLSDAVEESQPGNSGGAR